MPKPRSRSRRWFLSVLVLLSLLGTSVWAVLAPYRPASLPVTVEIGARASLSSIADQLADADAIRSRWLFQLLVRLTGNTRELKAGDYRMIKPLSMPEWLDKLKKGEHREYVVMIPEGFTFRQFRAELNKHPGLRHDTAGWSDARILQRLGLDAKSPEGLFFPDTYYFLKGASDLDVLRRAQQKMQTELEQVWQTRIAGLPLQTPYELLTLASLVEKETGHSEDRGQIAGVFINRLKIGMRLQTDPAVIYGAANYSGNLTRRHLTTDTPYNTYTRAGLPPTPIALPGRAALLAAANPTPTKALYFVARGDGSSHFSESLNEHNQAVRKYILNK